MRRTVALAPLDNNRVDAPANATLISRSWSRNIQLPATDGTVSTVDFGNLDI